MELEAGQTRRTDEYGAGSPANNESESGMTDRIELVQNAAGRMVPTMVNGKPQIPYLGVGKYQPRGRKAAPPVRSSKDYPDNGDKRVPDLETALRSAGCAMAW